MTKKRIVIEGGEVADRNNTLTVSNDAAKVLGKGYITYSN